MELSSCQHDRRWKLFSLRAYPDAASGFGAIDFFLARNHRTVFQDVYGRVVEEYSSDLPAAFLRLPLPVGLCRLPCFFTGTVSEFLNVELGMDPVAREHLLSWIVDAWHSVVRERGFYIRVELEVTTVSFEDDADLQPHRPCGASEAARRKLRAERFVPAAGDNEDGTCAICLEDLSSGSRNKRRLTKMPCTHVFHYRCISRWLDTSNTFAFVDLTCSAVYCSIVLLGKVATETSCRGATSLK